MIPLRTLIIVIIIAIACVYMIQLSFLSNSIIKQTDISLNTNEYIMDIKQNCDKQYHFKTHVPYVPSPPNQIPRTLTNKAEIIELQKQRQNHQVTYGGQGIDPKHLGGFVDNDTCTYERQMWEWIIDELNITSILDVGCGKGYSTVYFESHPNINNVHCIEGSSDAISNSLVPNITTQHDYELGPYWTKDEFDMVWSAEFLEHIKEEYMPNYMSTFKRAKVILVTHSVWGGWHHATIKRSNWWIYKFEQYGFVYMDELTQIARKKCPLLKQDFKYPYHYVNPKDGNRVNSHFHFRGLIFFNKLYYNRLTPFDCKLFRSQEKMFFHW